MKVIRKKTISDLLRYAQGNKGNTIPNTIVNQISNIITRATTKVYSYEVLYIYEHLSTNKDKNAFDKLDRLFFPREQQDQHFIQDLSLPIAYKRLYCLIKYSVPYNKWIEKLKPMVTDTKLNKNDYRSLMTLVGFDQIKCNDVFEEFITQVLNKLKADIYTMDSQTLISMLRYLKKSQIKTSLSIKIQQQIMQILDKVYTNMTNSQLKYLFQMKSYKIQWIEYYFIIIRNSIKRYGNFIMLLLKLRPWHQFILTSYQEHHIQSILTYYQQTSVRYLIDNLIGNCFFQRQFFDFFFQFGQNQAGLPVLVDPKVMYSSYLMNILLYLQTDSPLFKSLKDIDRMLHIVEIHFDDIPKNNKSVYLYFTVKIALLYHRTIQAREIGEQQVQRSMKIKKEEELKAITKISKIFSDPHYNPSNEDYNRKMNIAFLPSESLKFLASIEFQNYSTPQFKTIMDNFMQCWSILIKNVLTQRHPYKQNQIIDIIQEYSTLKKLKQNAFFSGASFKKQLNDHVLLVVSKEVAINDKLSADFLLKLTNSKTGKQYKYLLDLIKSQRWQISRTAHEDPLSLQKPNSKVPAIMNLGLNINKYWKYKYLVQWLKINYQMYDYRSIDEYLESSQFKQKVRQFQAN